MTVYEVVPIDDRVMELADTMRQVDVDEVWAAGHMSPKEALEQSIDVSRDTMMILIDGEVVGVFGIGVVVALSDTGIPWLLCSQKLVEKASKFLRYNKGYVDRAKKEYVKLHNYVDARNTYAIKWLRWLGFTVEKAAPFGMEQMPFHHFHWEAD